MIEDKETKIKINSYINKHQRQKSYLRTCAPSEDSDQTAHRNLHWVHFRDSQGCKIFSCEQVRLIRLHERASLFETFLGVRQKAFFPILLKCPRNFRIVRKRIRRHVLPAKYRPDCTSESSPGVLWIAKDTKLLRTENEDSDDTACMRRLNWVFVSRICQKVPFLTLRFKCLPTLLSFFFQEVDCLLALHSEEVNLWNFVMIQCKTFCRNYLCMKRFV